MDIIVVLVKSPVTTFLGSRTSIVVDAAWTEHRRGHGQRRGPPNPPAVLPRAPQNPERHQRQRHRRDIGIGIVDRSDNAMPTSSCPRPRTPPSPFASYFRGGGRGRSPFSSPFLPLPDPFPSPDSRPNELAGASDLRDDDYDYDATFNRRSRAASSPAGRRIPTAWRSSHHRPVPPSSYPSPDRDRRARRSRRWTTMTAAEDDIATSGRRDAFDTVS